MDLTIIRKEKLGIGENAKTVTEDICTVELMDGSPIKGLIIRRRNTNSTFFEWNSRTDIKYDEREQ